MSTNASGSYTKANPKVSLVIGLVLVGLALLGYWNVAQEALRAYQSQSWPQTEAVIHDIGVTMQDSMKAGRDTWTVHTRYTYTVNGTEHDGDTIRLGGFPSTSSEEEAAAVAAMYPMLGHVQVAYNPQKPEQSVLQPGLGGALNGLSLGAFLLTLVFGLGALVVYQATQQMKVATQ